MTFRNTTLLCVDNFERLPKACCRRNTRVIVRFTSCALSDSGAASAMTTITIAELNRLIARKATRWLSVASWANCGSSVTLAVLTAASHHCRGLDDGETVETVEFLRELEAKVWGSLLALGEVQSSRKVSIC